MKKKSRADARGFLNSRLLKLIVINLLGNNKRFAV
jgi:hypothetical protein